MCEPPQLTDFSLGRLKRCEPSFEMMISAKIRDECAARAWITLWLLLYRLERGLPEMVLRGILGHVEVITEPPSQHAGMCTRAVDRGLLTRHACRQQEATSSERSDPHRVFNQKTLVLSTCY